jgi:hypothetical protein
VEAYRLQDSGVKGVAVSSTVFTGLRSRSASAVTVLL